MLEHAQPESGPRRPRFSYASVAATLALVLSLSGTAYALVVTSADIQDNTIRSVDIRNGQVRTKDIGNGQVFSADIRDGSIQAVDLDPSAQKDPRLTVFSEILAWGANPLVVTVGDSGYTFKGFCGGAQHSDAGVELVGLPGSNFVASEMVKIEGSVLPDFYAWGMVGADMIHAWNVVDRTESGVAQLTLSSISPLQLDGSLRSARVEVSMTANSAGCTFSGTATDTSS